jgi:predicted nucleotidyltransferase
VSANASPKLFAIYGQSEAEQRSLDVVRAAVQSVEKAGIPYLLIGGLASALVGRPRYTKDADLFVRPEDAQRTLDALEAAGFTTERTDEEWLYKGFRDGHLVDVIFKLSGDLYLDEEMLARARIEDLKGCTARVISPEDLLVAKAFAFKEVTPRHWFDALALLAEHELDWNYVLRRSRHGVRRLLSLLIYAQSADIQVPSAVIRQLYKQVYEDE